MQLDFFCPLWGSEQLPFEIFLANVKSAGYDGIEMSFPMDSYERNSIVTLIRNYGLKLVAQHWETVDKDFQTHKINYKNRLLNLAATNPLFINSQTGKDYYTFEQNAELIHIAKTIENETGITIIHETHRGKFSFAAHIAEDYFNRLPDLKICLDISHWFCVAETLLEDQANAVETAIQRTRHIHSRIGFTEGPQIMDPRAEENALIVDRHITLWQKVVNNFKKNGSQRLTITPEFGAPPYLQLMPHTRVPIYSQWDVNEYMMGLLKQKLNII
ncbi:MAG: sugar phosphate isomerase/epimerase [Chitinophagaceae bacterium]|nr:sugar phosphate isomerase/epimerase [Chitinophagaceae bacterium]